MESHEAQIAKIVRKYVANRNRDEGETGWARAMQHAGEDVTLTVGLETGTGTWLAHVIEDESLVFVVPNSAVVERESDTSEGGPRAVVVRIDTH
jgi:hypothetical protein